LTSTPPIDTVSTPANKFKSALCFESNTRGDDDKPAYRARRPYSKYMQNYAHVVPDSPRFVQHERDFPCIIARGLRVNDRSTSSALFQFSVTSPAVYKAKGA
jgi:hypothetical protein